MSENEAFMAAIQEDVLREEEEQKEAEAMRRIEAGEDFSESQKRETERDVEDGDEEDQEYAEGEEGHEYYEEEEDDLPEEEEEVVRGNDLETVQEGTETNQMTSEKGARQNNPTGLEEVEAFNVGKANNA